MASDRFVQGYLAACQNLVAMGYDAQTEELIRESGETVETLLAAQRESGYQSRRMCPLIRQHARPTVPDRELELVATYSYPSDQTSGP